MSIWAMERHNQQEAKMKEKSKQKFRSQIISKREFLYGCGGGHQNNYNSEEMSQTRKLQTKQLEVVSIHERHSN